MKWMGWGWKQLCEAPPHIITRIKYHMMREAEGLERIQMERG